MRRTYFLSRQVAIARKNLAEWPEWLRTGSGMDPLTPSEKLRAIQDGNRAQQDESIAAGMRFASQLERARRVNAEAKRSSLDQFLPADDFGDDFGL